MTSPRLTRTYLAVPAHRARLVQNAAASAADAVFLDLEDAVPPAEKEAALEAAAMALTMHDWGRKTVAVRLNTIDSPSIQQEIKRLGDIKRLDAFIIPKAEAASDIAKISGWISGAAATRDAPAEMELLIETARGLINVEALAAADSLVTALHLGVGDFAASIGARSAEIGASPPGYRHVGSAAEGHPQIPLDLFAYPMMRVLVAARAFGLRAIDGPCGAFRDAVATSATAAKAAAMGYDGKQVIHPSQIEATRDAFIPTDDELAYAQRVTAAMEEAERNGQAAVTVDGRMVDYANIRMIRRLMSFKGQAS
ncbi:MAG TPA: CoA ester lyase [Xanthobacteraceae bacterium]|jgi:malyl-CoA/(S)-citramalyl-CoA lyase